MLSGDIKKFDTYAMPIILSISDASETSADLLSINLVFPYYKAITTSTLLFIIVPNIPVTTITVTATVNIATIIVNTANTVTFLLVNLVNIK